MVSETGIEPAASWSQITRSSSWATHWKVINCCYEDFYPSCCLRPSVSQSSISTRVFLKFVTPEGFEPPSIQLRYYRLEVCSDTESWKIYRNRLLSYRSMQPSCSGFCCTHSRTRTDRTRILSAIRLPITSCRHIYAVSFLTLPILRLVREGKLLTK